MKQKDWALVIGALLHDIGKVIYRQGQERKTHSEIGYEYLKDILSVQNDLKKDILEMVRYHHASPLKGARITQESPAYIVYMADNIAAAADRREKEGGESGFEIHTPLQPVFDILNGNHGNSYYEPTVMDGDRKINYPQKEKKLFKESDYQKIVRAITDNLKGMDWQPEYVNSLLEVLEANLAYIPSSTSQSERADISLYDHMKLTAAAASCIKRYLDEQGCQDYHEKLFAHGKDFYGEEAFLLASLDISGIQSFIYTITSKNALRSLRARSFYLEIMMEHLIDELLSRLELSRTNLIYSGGGHCYLLLANTERCKNEFKAFLEETNEWFLENYQNALYIAGSMVTCSSNALKNIPEGSYSQLFVELSKGLSEKKSHRYTAAQIIKLNQTDWGEYTRECKACKRLGKVNIDGFCPVCVSLQDFSSQVLYSEFFSVLRDHGQAGVILPGGFKLVADDAEALKERIIERREGESDFVRAYSKNQYFTGESIATHLWTGSYTTGAAFGELANASQGIKRIGVLRADVDNLGTAFVFGFENPKFGSRYVTLSRTATLSRQLSFFFKGFINEILKEPWYSMTESFKAKRQAVIVYSGGDDVFIAGAWDDIIELSVDLQKAFTKYTEGTLTISAGIGLYDSSYPVSAIASEVADMEGASKSYPGKNAVTLLEDGTTHTVKAFNRTFAVSDGTYPWEEFTRIVVEEKLAKIREFFDSSQDRGMSFLYRLMELIRAQKEPINFARYVYLLSRMEPDKEAKEDQKDAYRKFASQMIRWVQKKDDGDNEDIRQLKTALTLYAYLNRETEEGEK